MSFTFNGHEVSRKKELQEAIKEHKEFLKNNSVSFLDRTGTEWLLKELRSELRGVNKTLKK